SADVTSRARPDVRRRSTVTERPHLSRRLWTSSYKKRATRRFPPRFRPPVVAPFWLVLTQQRFNPELCGWVRVEQTEQPGGAEGLDDEHVCSGRIRVKWDGARGRLDLAESAHEPLWAAGDDGAAGVGVELARARNRRLNEHCGDRRQDDRRDQRERIGPFPIVAPAPPEEHRKARNHHDRGRSC